MCKISLKDKASIKIKFNKTIQMCIFNGEPNGRIMCELSNWNGRIYKICRNDLIEFETREDSQNTGIYFLFGKTDDNNDAVYIGEAEHIYTRLKQHLTDDFYWNDCIVVISKDDLLNKAHIKYLESKFYNLAKQSNRFFIINNKIPTCSSVSEYDESMLAEFLANSKLLINTLGYKAFEMVKEEFIENIQKNIFYISSVRNANAQGILVAGGFAVLKGSVIAHTVTPTMPSSLKVLRNKLFAEKIVSEDFIFNNDYVFSSPSTAAAIVMGRSANGRTEWKTAENKSLKELESKSE